MGFRFLKIIGGVAVLTAVLTSCTLKSAKNEPANTVHMALPEKLKGLDPILSDDLYANSQVSMVYETLLEYHYLKRPYVLVPLLAESMPETSTDPKTGRQTLTFRLKKGVLFQDDSCFKETGGKGREVTAQDVVYSLERLADPKLNSTGWWTLDGKIVGLNEWREESEKAPASDYSKPVEGLKAIDRYTVQIVLKQPSAQFLFSLALPFASIVPREAVEKYGKDFISHPVGTGPFHLDEYNPASKLVWNKSPTYRHEVYPGDGEPSDQAGGLLADAGKPLPLADRVVVEVYVEDQPMWLNFLKGNLELAAIPKDNFSQAISAGNSKELSPELKAKGIQLSITPGDDVTHESFNMSDPVVGKNKYLRQALSLAVDTRTLIDLFYNGRAIPAQGPIPPGLAGYDPDFKDPYRQYNVQKAKELLAKAGFPDGKGLDPIQYETVSNSTSRQMNEFLEKSFQAIGVTLKINAQSWPEFQSGIRNKKGQMYGFAWSADYPDAENFLQLFITQNVSPGSNDSNYSNPEFDRLYAKSLALTDGPERTALYQQMTKILVEDCPWIFGVHRLIYGLTQPWLKNYKAHAFSHTGAKYLRVDPALKK